MARAVITKEALIAARNLPQEDLIRLAVAQNKKAHEARENVTPPGVILLGLPQRAFEESIYYAPSDEALKKADDNLAKAQKSGSKEDYLRAYQDSALAVLSISQQDSDENKEWNKYIVNPIVKHVLNPMKDAAIQGAAKAGEVIKQAASGLNETILYLGIGYILVNAAQKTVRRF